MADTSQIPPTSAPPIAAGSIQFDDQQGLIVTSMSNTSMRLNILPIVSEMSIYENISQPFVSMDITVTDSLALTSVFPFVGDELVSVMFRVPSLSFLTYEHVFRIVSVKQMQTTNVRAASYLIRCLSIEAIADFSTSIKHSYSNMLTKDMVSQICQTYLHTQKAIVTSNTTGMRTIVIPNMTPTRAIRFLARESKSDLYVPSNFVFFEIAEQFNFKTIEEMINATANDSFFIGDKNMNNSYITPSLGTPSTATPISSTAVTKPPDFLKINGFTFLNLFDYERNIHAGAFDNLVLGVNPNTSTAEQNIYSYTNDFNTFKHTVSANAPGKFMHSNSDTANMNGGSRNSMLITNRNQQDASLDPKYDFLRYLVASVALLDNVVVNVTVPGDSSRRAGDVINLNFPEFGSTDDVKGNLNRFVSGKYLVTAVKHNYSATDGYSTVMQCVKNCYETSPDNAINSNSPAAPTSTTNNTVNSASPSSTAMPPVSSGSQTPSAMSGSPIPPPTSVETT